MYYRKLKANLFLYKNTKSLIVHKNKIKAKSETKYFIKKN